MIGPSDKLAELPGQVNRGRARMDGKREGLGRYWIVIKWFYYSLIFCFQCTYNTVYLAEVGLKMSAPQISTMVEL